MHMCIVSKQKMMESYVIVSFYFVLQTISLFLLSAYFKVLQRFPAVALISLLMYVGCYQVLALWCLHFYSSEWCSCTTGKISVCFSVKLVIYYLFSYIEFWRGREKCNFLYKVAIICYCIFLSVAELNSGCVSNLYCIMNVLLGIFWTN